MAMIMPCLLIVKADVVAKVMIVEKVKAKALWLVREMSLAKVSESD